MKQLNVQTETTLFITKVRSILCAIVLLMSITAAADTYYVKADGDDEATGLSWEDAKASIDGALLIADENDQVFVKQGTYSVSVSISMKEGVNVYGGFTGTESDLDERPALVFGKTDDGEASVLDGNASQRILSQPENFNTETVWDGFVIQNGNNNRTYNENDVNSGHGGGVYLGAKGVLNNATVTNNIANGRGGGIWCNYAGKVSNCLVINNKSNSEGGGIAAGRENSRATIINCLITNNTAVSDGGGMVCQFADIINCTITNNHSNTNGGGILAYTNAPIITNCIVWNNTKASTGTAGAQINGGGGGNTHASSSYFATLGAYGGQAVANTKMELAATNTGEGTANYPAFVNQSTIIGYTTDETQIAAIFAADWQLTVHSACKDAGTPDPSALPLPDVDAAGNPRIFNDRIDIGAFEYKEIVIKSNDATLQTLTAEPGTLYPVFSAEETEYAVEVPFETTTITLTATATHSEAEVDGDTGEQALNVGENPFAIVVTAEDGTQKTYTIVVTRRLATAIANTGAAATVRTDLATSRLFIETVGNVLPNVKLYDLQGKLLLQKQSKEIDLSGFEAGTYLLKVNGTAVKIIKK
jgi:hypothetical protein